MTGRDHGTAGRPDAPVWIWDSRDRDAPGGDAVACLFSRANGHAGVQAAPLAPRGRGVAAPARLALLEGHLLREPYRYPEWTFGQARANERLLPLPYPLGLALRARGARIALEGERWWLDGEAAAAEAVLLAHGHPVTLLRRFHLADDGAPEIEEEVAVTNAGTAPVSLLVAFLVADRRPDAAARRDPDPRRPDPSAPTHRLRELWVEGGMLHGLWTAPAPLAPVAVDMAVAGPGCDRRLRLLRGAEGPGLVVPVHLEPGARARWVRRIRMARGSGAVGPSRFPRAGTGDRSPAPWARQWAEAALVRLAGAPRLEAALRHDLAQLRAQLPRRCASIAAKGLTGEGYAGHVFWDADVYILPAVTALAPGAAREMLRWRARQLDAARARARELDLPGALYPWRTISGEECSAYFPAGTAQVHLNAGIAYAAEVYWRMTGDEGFVFGELLEMLVETARLWPGIGHFTGPERFEIPCVTGPDEYSALVDNNAYTNVMAAAHLSFVTELLGRLARRDPDAHARLAARLGLTDEEVALFARIARHLVVPRLADPDIPAQDDGFVHRRPWPEHRRLRPVLLHYHPLEIYRHRIIKQADTLLAMVLRRARFSAAEMARAFAFYAPLTTHDSSLSAAPHAILAAWIGDWTAAERFFAETALIDLEDRHGNTGDGLHLAAIAGAWRVLAEGLAGFDPLAPEPSFAPRLPPWLDGYALRLWWRGSLIEIAVDAEAVRYRLCAGPARGIRHHGERLTLAGHAIRPTAAAAS